MRLDASGPRWRKRLLGNHENSVVAAAAGVTMKTQSNMSTARARAQNVGLAVGMGCHANWAKLTGAGGKVEF